MYNVCFYPLLSVRCYEKVNSMCEKASSREEVSPKQAFIACDGEIGV